MLRQHGFGATVFVIAGRLGGDNAWDPEGPRKRLMDAPEVWALAQAGIEIGSHGLRHVRLPGAGDTLAEEVGESRRILREVTGKPVGGFCYPYGDLDAGAVTQVRDSRLRLRLRHLAVSLHGPARAAADLHRGGGHRAPPVGQDGPAPADLAAPAGAGASPDGPRRLISLTQRRRPTSLR